MPLNTEPYTGWGRVLTGTGGRARPEKSASLARIMGHAPGPAIGALRSYGDAALSDAPAVDMSRMDRLLSFDTSNGVLEAEAGVPLATLLELFGPRGWMPAVMPGTGHATLGGAIAADVHGKNHHAAGSFGQHVLGLRLIGADGQVRDISPDVEGELFRATLGGMGLTGVIESATIQLAPCPSVLVDVQERRMPNLASYIAAFEDSEATFSVGWIDATGTGDKLGRGILEEAEFVTREAAFFQPRKAPKTVPFNAPGFAMAAPVVRAFNQYYYSRIPKTGRHSSKQIAAFFHPLDGLSGWNKLYGKRGFHQFQCVLPPANAALVLDAMLREIGRSGLAAPLAVLKKMGPGRAGPLSFPMEGYTLAVDFASRPGVAQLIERLIDQTVEAEGRVYLAKDSLAAPDHIAPMYDELGDFRAVVRQADPDGVFETDLARRLNLRGTA
ncbi:MAG: FAD-binding oxidoreductase [Pseudomonadota bacterium]